MNYLVSGGAGFIGSHLIPKLLELGHNVVSVDNYFTGKSNNHVDGCKYHFVNIDYEDNFTPFMESPDYIIHLAYPYGVDGMGLDDAYIQTGLQGTYNLLKYGVKTKVKKLVNISSVSAYGILTESPIQENMEGKPFIHYGVTKKASEEYCKIFKGTYGLDTVNLRLFYAYGERYATFDHSALVNFLDRAKKGEDLIIYGDGKQVRSYTYVSDIVDGILSSVHGESNGEVYNISGGSTCNILELAETVLNVTKAKSNVIFSKPNEYRYSDDYVKIPLGVTKQLKDGTWIDERNYIADNTKALKDFGYNPKINLVDGINKTWEWMNK